MVTDKGHAFSYIGLSTDTKPSFCVYGEIPNGSTFFEIDTEKTYYYRTDEGWYNKDDTPHLASISATHSGTVYAGYPWFAEDPSTNYTVSATDDASPASTTTVTGFELSYPDVLTEAGSKTVGVTYRTGGIKKTTTVSVTVTAPAYSSLTIKTAPTKTEYTVGEFFDPTGLVVKVNYNDTRKSREVAYSPDDINFSFTPSLTTALSNETSVAISYTVGSVSKSKNQSITVTEPEE